MSVGRLELDHVRLSGQRRGHTTIIAPREQPFRCPAGRGDELAPLIGDVQRDVLSLCETSGELPQVGQAVGGDEDADQDAAGLAEVF